MFTPPAIRVRVLFVAILSIAALVFLATSVSNLEFSVGDPYASRLSKGGPLSLPQDLLDALLNVLFFIAPTLILVGVIYALAASGFRARALLWFLWSALMVAALYLGLRAYPLMFRHLPQRGPAPDPAALTPVSTVIAVEPGEYAPSPPPEWAEPVFTVAVALLVSAGVVAGAWAVTWRIARRARPIDDLAGEARRALHALRAGADVRDTVMSCYFQMGRVLDEHYGLVRTEAMTPREFEQLLAALDLPRPHVQRLTRLFEMVRYGSHVATDTQEQEAIACLTAIAGIRRPEHPIHAESRP